MQFSKPFWTDLDLTNEISSSILAIQYSPFLTVLVSRCRDCVALSLLCTDSLSLVTTEKVANNIFFHLRPTQLIRAYSTDWLASPKVCVVGLAFSELEMGKPASFPARNEYPF